MSDLFADDEKHESFAMLGFNRVQCGGDGMILHGSDLKHNTIIEMNLYHSHKRRGLSKDWHHADESIAKVSMSQNQFAELITSMNMGDGIPVTLTYTETDGLLNPPEFNSLVETHQTEFKNQVGMVSEDARTLLATVKELLGKTGTVKKAEKEAIIEQAEKVVREIHANMPFMGKSFEESIDKVVTDAKGTIEAFYQHRVIDTGLSALENMQVDPSPKMIDME